MKEAGKLRVGGRRSERGLPESAIVGGFRKKAQRTGKSKTGDGARGNARWKGKKVASKIGESKKW